MNNVPKNDSKRLRWCERCESAKKTAAINQRLEALALSNSKNALPKARITTGLLKRAQSNYVG